MNCHLRKSYRKIALGSVLLAWASIFCPLIAGEASEMEVLYAKNFEIESMSGGKLVTVLHAYQGAGDEAYRYFLYPRGTVRPKLKDVDAYVEVPVERAIVLSTTFLAAIDLLDEVESLVGVGAIAYINTPSVLASIDAGNITEVGSETMKNVEMMVSLDPDIVFTNIVGSPDYDIHPTLERMGVVSAITAAYMEQTILGRAEWIKFVGAFYGKDEEATARFEKIEEAYLELKKTASSAEARPTVFANAPWGNVWYVPSGKSFIAAMIEDAGGDYLWSGLDREGSQPMDFESVYERAIDADFWINSGYLETMSILENQDERYLDFSAVKSGNVFSETLRVSEQGGNDIWERGFVHPEEILADLIHILHPELLSQHQLIYYKPVR